MIHVRWRHAGRTGKIIVRGTDNLFLFAYTLVPPARVCPMSGTSQDNSEFTRDLCCYYHTISCVGDASLSCDNSAGKATKRARNAVSMGFDVKKHPVISIMYQELFSGVELIIGNVNVTYNTLRFKRGFFADSVMQSHGYGVLLLCHSTPDNPAMDITKQKLFHFVNWRQCRSLMTHQVENMGREIAKTMAIDAKRPLLLETGSGIQQNVKSAEIAVSENNDSSWDTSLYQSLKNSVCSTFNLLL